MKADDKLLQTAASQQGDVAAWTEFWARSGSDASNCLPSAPPYAAGHLENLWQDFFMDLPEAGKILDLGTGGGAVPSVAQRTRGDLDITGVDYAAALPSPHPSIRMVPGVALESLPFADHSFDAVTSQFALEYADRTTAVPELQRVLKPRGAILIIAHHSDGAVLGPNMRRLAAIEEILSPGNLYDQVEDIAGKGREPDAASRGQLTEQLHRLRERHPKLRIVNELALWTARTMVEENALQKLAGLRDELGLEIRRLSSLRSAALSERQARALAKDISPTHSCELSAIEIPEEATPLAWQIATPR